MEVNSESLRFILGVKVKQFRQEKGLSLKELSGVTGLSVSYLSEIEKGKKYPKLEKIILLAQGLDKTFDDLVSLQLDDSQNPVSALVNSPLFKEFPLQQFGITLTDVFDLVTNTPSKAGAFVRTLLEIGRTYDMHVEHFLLAALRSYQKMHLNYFEELEQAATKFREQHAELVSDKLPCDGLERLLQKEFGVEVLYESMDEQDNLSSLRSVWIQGAQEKLIINRRLFTQQRVFVLLREIGYRYMNLTPRPITSSWIKAESFDEVLNNFKASYFAGAVTLPEHDLKLDLTELLSMPTWQSDKFESIINKYSATPETFVYRISQLLPHHFGLKQMHYLRLQNEAGIDKFHLTKELNTTNIFVPRGVGPNEHHCRRWVSISLLKNLAEHQSQGKNIKLMVAAQRSKFLASGEEFFNIAIARPMSLNNNMNAGMTLGFQIDKQFKDTVKFWNDDSVPQMDVNETCERCPLSESQCESRIAEPSILDEKFSLEMREQSLQQFIENHKS